MTQMSETPTQNLSDEDFMRLALLQAEQAASAGEVPVGAVVVKEGVVIGVGSNRPIVDHDPTAHAEIMALRAAAKHLGSYRLEGCTLYVTLEPCAMCAGAMLHARIERLVYGATEPKTGAAGSVINLFTEAVLNHQTSVQAGVLAEACAGLMQLFFLTRRTDAKALAKTQHPLRDDAVRTADHYFDGLPDYPWPPQYLSDLPTLAGLRLHYLDVPMENENENAHRTTSARHQPPITWLCLHGNPAWSYLYRKMIPILAKQGRVVAPDLIGFGKSDKPKKESAHHFDWHRQVLLELIERLDLQNIILVVQDWGGLLGLTLPMSAPQRYRGLLVMNTYLATGTEPLSPGFIAWRKMCAQNPAFDIARLFARGNPHMSAAECAAYMAPFPDKGHRSATRAFPPMVPESPVAEGAIISQQAQHFWANHWQGQSLMIVGTQDPVLGLASMQALHPHIRQCPEPILLPQAGHFVQEHGQEVAAHAVRYFCP